MPVNRPSQRRNLGPTKPERSRRNPSRRTKPSALFPFRLSGDPWPLTGAGRKCPTSSGCMMRAMPRAVIRPGRPSSTTLLRTIPPTRAASAQIGVRVNPQLATTLQQEADRQQGQADERRLARATPPIRYRPAMRLSGWGGSTWPTTSASWMSGRAQSAQGLSVLSNVVTAFRRRSPDPDRTAQHGPCTC